MDSKLVFRQEDGLLHVIGPQAAMFLQAFQREMGIAEICAHMDDAKPDECQQKLTQLQQHWRDIGLLLSADQVPQHIAPYQLTIQPGLEAIQLTTNCSELFAYLEGLYPPVSADECQVMTHIDVQYVLKNSSYYQIEVNGQPKHQSTGLTQAILATCFEIGEAAIHEEPRLLVAHAAAVTHDQNVWLLPATAGSGKSTLAAVLLQNGYQLINDDVVPVNHDGTVTALNLPLKIKSGAWPILAPLYPQLRQATMILRADHLQMKNLAIPAESSCPAGAKYMISGMISPLFDPSQDEPVLERLSSAQKLQALLQAEPHFTHRLTRPYLLQVLAWLENIPAYSIRYSSSQQALQLMEKLPQ